MSARRSTFSCGEIAFTDDYHCATGECCLTVLPTFKRFIDGNQIGASREGIAAGAVPAVELSELGPGGPATAAVGRFSL